VDIVARMNFEMEFSDPEDEPVVGSLGSTHSLNPLSSSPRHRNGSHGFSSTSPHSTRSPSHQRRRGSSGIDAEEPVEDADFDELVKTGTSVPMAELSSTRYGDGTNNGDIHNYEGYSNKFASDATRLTNAATTNGTTGDIITGGIGGQLSMHEMKLEEERRARAAELQQDQQSKREQDQPQHQDEQQQGEQQQQPEENNTTMTTTTTTTTSDKNFITPKDFELLCVIGMGSFGKVLQVRSKSTRKIAAMKIISKRLLKKKNFVQNINAERDIMTKVNHPFIVKMHCSFQTGSKLFLVMDFLAGGELFFMLGKQVSNVLITILN